MTCVSRQWCVARMQIHHNSDVMGQRRRAARIDSRGHHDIRARYSGGCWSLSRLNAWLKLTSASTPLPCQRAFLLLITRNAGGSFELPGIASLP
jgi:hypothetical protein